jgi:nicotinamidase-related amidase
MSDLQKPTRRINRAKTALAVVDLQERLLPAIWEHDRVVQNSVRLIEGASLLGCLVVATEQYRKGLGPTEAGVAASLKSVKPLQKLTFSACGAEGLLAALTAKEISDVVVCGIEAHVCVTQTCLDLLDSGYRVFVAADAVSSRTAENRRIGLERMRDAGATLVSTEMVLFELLERAGTEEFKRILALVK